MVRHAQVVILLVFVAAAASEPQLAPVQHAVNAVNSVVDGLLGKYRDNPSSSITVSPDKEPNGDVGFSMSGSAARPPSGSIHTGRPRPTVNDVINALKNLTTKNPDEPVSSPEATIPGDSNPPTSQPINLPVDSQPPIIHESAPYPTIQPIYPPVEVPLQPTVQPIYPNEPGNTTPESLNVLDPGMVQNPLDMSNHSIIILNLNDLYGLQNGASSLQQLFSMLNGKPGFVFVMTGGQGKFIPLNQLHLLPQNGIPSYIVLLTSGRPNPFPGLQLVSGLLQNGNHGNLGFQIPNLGNFGSLPIYVVQGYYPIWTILMNLGISQPDNSFYLPHPDPTPYPGIVYPTSYPGPTPQPIQPTNPPFTFPQPTNPPIIIPQPTNPPIIIPQPTNPPVVVPEQPNFDLNDILAILNNNNGNGFPINSNKEDNDVSDTELIKILLHVLNEKPGSETEHVIVKEKKNPTKLLRILIELLGEKTGKEHVVIENKNENNPSKLLLILIKLLRQRNASNPVITKNDNSEQRLIQLLIKLIRQRDDNHVVISRNNDGSQAKLVQILIQLLGNQDQMNRVLISGQNNNGQSQLLQYLIQLLGASNPEAGHILVSGYNDASSAQKLYNILLQMITSMTGASNLGGNTIYLNGGSGYSGISTESLMQLVQILLRQQQSNPTMIFKNREPSYQPFMNRGSNSFGNNSKILTMLLGSGAGGSNKSALWSYLLGNLGCMNHNGLTLLCAK